MKNPIPVYRFESKVSVCCHGCKFDSDSEDEDESDCSSSSSNNSPKNNNNHLSLSKPFEAQVNVSNQMSSIQPK